MNALQEKQNRMVYLSKIRTHLIDFIYSAKNKLIESELVKIAHENGNLLNTGSTFIFEGKWYPSYVTQSKRSNDLNRQLHPSLLERVVNLVHEPDYDHFEEKHILLNYVGSVLQFAKHSADLKEIFPYPVHDALSFIKPRKFTVDYFPKPKEEVLAFKQANSIGSDCLNQLLVIRMVLKGD